VLESFKHEHLKTVKLAQSPQEVDSLAENFQSDGAKRFVFWLLNGNGPNFQIALRI
jgi:hypothetical protein